MRKEGERQADWGGELEYECKNSIYRGLESQGQLACGVQYHSGTKLQDPLSACSHS